MEFNTEKSDCDQTQPHHHFLYKLCAKIHGSSDGEIELSKKNF